MRNIRARRRFKALLVILLALSFIAFFESRIEAFAPQFKVLAEGRIEDMFSGKVDISIGALKGGIVSPFAIHDVKILKKDGSASADIVDIENITSNYRIWNFIFPNFVSSKPYVTIDFSTKNGILSGFILLQGTKEDASIKGNIRLFDGDKIDLSGDIKNGVANIILRPKEGYVKIEYNFAASGVAILKIIAGHVKLQHFDITGEATIKNVTEENLEGEVEAKNIILNYKPFNDVRASYRISKEAIEIRNLDLGRVCYINGKFGLKDPYIVDAIAVTDNVNLEQTLAIFNPRYASFIAGIMNSKWELKGPIDKLRSKVRLEIKKGRISEMKFEFLSADLKGDGPIVTIDDSRITRESGSFTLAGYMDMARIGKDSFFENLKIIDGADTVLWDGYDTAKWQDVREFKMKKNIVGDINIGFKKYVNDEKVDESLRDRDEYELSYNLHPNDSIKLKFSDNKNFFGLEHKDKF
ncbi:MAG: hypothetical protein Q8R38_02325 [Candidatus Omnitrophota bacterium]|nr:hypothetical protein [Candidatus Omnitrophota bacterium]